MGRGTVYENAGQGAGRLAGHAFAPALKAFAKWVQEVIARDLSSLASKKGTFGKMGWLIGASWL